jgi:integrase
VLGVKAVRDRLRERRTYLDAERADLLRAHRRAQLAARMRASAAWEDNDLVFCREDGSGYKPEYVYRRFVRLTKDAGLPVIRLHDGRHTAAGQPVPITSQPERHSDSCDT